MENQKKITLSTLKRIKKENKNRDNENPEPKLRKLELNNSCTTLNDLCSSSVMEKGKKHMEDNSVMNLNSNQIFS